MCYKKGFSLFDKTRKGTRTRTRKKKKGDTENIYFAQYSHRVFKLAAVPVARKLKIAEEK